MRQLLSCTLLLSAFSTPALATETITYSYDSHGRLIKTVESGTVNNGVTTTYQHDKADNRTNVTVTGSSH